MSTSSGSGIRVLVTGAGGFIGHHLVTFLKGQGYWVRGVDLKHPEYAPTDADEFEIRDLRRWENCLEATRGIEEVYALAADMGGMGFHLLSSRRDPAQQYSDQHAHARCGAGEWRPSVSLHLVGLCLSRVSAGRHQRRATARGTRIPGCAAGRVWMGETDHGAALRALP